MMVSKRQHHKPVKVWILWWYSETDGWIPFDSGNSQTVARSKMQVWKSDDPESFYRTTIVVTHAPKGRGK